MNPLLSAVPALTIVVLVLPTQAETPAQAPVTLKCKFDQLIIASPKKGDVRPISRELSARIVFSAPRGEIAKVSITMSEGPCESLAGIANATKIIAECKHTWSGEKRTHRLVLDRVTGAAEDWWIPESRRSFFHYEGRCVPAKKLF